MDLATKNDDPTHNRRRPGHTAGERFAIKTRWPRTVFIRGVTCALALAVAGCATKERRRWLSVFFDGVPAEGTKPARSASPQTPQTPQALTNATVSSSLAPAAEPTVHMHPPYADRQCDRCHESKFSQKMKAQGKALCFGCHADFLAGARFIHAPAEAGDCTGCHDAHQSENPFMLLRKGQAVCYECHERADVTKKTAHQLIGEKACTTCHDPHRGAREFFLKQAGESSQSGAKPGGDGPAKK